MGELLAAFVIVFLPVVDRCDALAALDAVRAHAWATGDTALLTSIYAADVGASDVESLAAWRERGITVDGARTIRDSCHEVADAVEVVERLGPMVAHLPDGARRPLPEDDWTRRRIEVAYAGHWRIVSVR